MPNLTSIGISSGQGSSGTGTVSTLDALLSAVGTPSSLPISVQASTANFNVVVSSGTIASLSSGTVNISGGAVFAAAGSPSATQVLSVQASTNGLQIASSQIGTLGQTTMANSVPTTLASNQTTISVAQDVSQLANGASGTFLTAASTKTTATSSGATTLVSSQASKKIRILSGWVSANGPVNINFQSHTTTTNATGLTYLASAGDGMVLPFNPIGWFTTNSSEGLDIFLSAASSVDGYIQYVLV